MRIKGNAMTDYRLVPVEPDGWYTEVPIVGKSVTTYSAEVAQRWRDQGWPVWPLDTAPQPAPDEDALEHEVRAMVGLLANGEWAGTHPRTDLGAALECQITKLVDRRATPDVSGLLGVLGQYFDAMDAIGREGTATSALIAEAECDEAEARLRVLLANHRKQEPSHDNQ